MDDYRDLTTAALVLFFAGVMLVAGQLYLEHSTREDLGKEIELPHAPASSPVLSSNVPTTSSKMTEPRVNPAKKRST